MDKGREYNPTCTASGRREFYKDVIFSGTYDDALKQFMDWALDWLDEDNSDSGIELYEQLLEKYNSGETFTSFEYDSKYYSFDVSMDQLYKDGKEFIIKNFDGITNLRREGNSVHIYATINNVIRHASIPLDTNWNYASRDRLLYILPILDEEVIEIDIDNVDIDIYKV